MNGELMANGCFVLFYFYRDLLVITLDSFDSFTTTITPLKSCMEIYTELKL